MVVILMFVVACRQPDVAERAVEAPYCTAVLALASDVAPHAGVSSLPASVVPLLPLPVLLDLLHVGLGQLHLELDGPAADGLLGLLLQRLGLSLRNPTAGGVEDVVSLVLLLLPHLLPLLLLLLLLLLILAVVEIPGDGLRHRVVGRVVAELANVRRAAAGGGRRRVGSPRLLPRGRRRLSGARPLRRPFLVRRPSALDGCWRRRRLIPRGVVLSYSPVISVLYPLDERVVEHPLCSDDAQGRPAAAAADPSSRCTAAGRRRSVGARGAAAVVGPGLEVDDAVLPPLVLLHGLLPVELLVADVALEGPVVSMRPLVYL